MPMSCCVCRTSRSRMKSCGNTCAIGFSNSKTIHEPTRIVSFCWGLMSWWIAYVQAKENTKLGCQVDTVMDSPTRIVPRSEAATALWFGVPPLGGLYCVGRNRLKAELQTFTNALL